MTRRASQPRQTALLLLLAVADCASGSPGHLAPTATAYHATLRSNTAYLVYNPGPLHDGVGAQSVRMLLAECVALHSGPRAAYVHAPFAGISHNESFEQAAWEAYLELVGDENLRVGDIEPALTLKLPSISTPQHGLRPGLYKIDRYGGTVTHPKQIAQCSALFRARFAMRSRWEFSVEPQRLRCPQEEAPCLTVAIHVRRGDVHPNGQNAKRWVPDEYYVALLAELRACAALRGVTLDAHVFSEGETADFENLVHHVDALHLSHTAYQDLDAMIHADVFVMGSSSFSYLAALLHTGHLVVANGNEYATWHASFTPATHWARTARNGTLLNGCPQALRVAM